MSRQQDYFVYILTNYAHTVLYIGVTNDLARRVWEHEHGVAEGFTKRYHLDRLIYYEHCRDVQAAIAREKQLKNWSRAKKETLIARQNPQWLELNQTLDPQSEVKVALIHPDATSACAKSDTGEEETLNAP